MKKTIFSIAFLLCFLAFNSVRADVNQPLNGNKVTVQVVSGEKIYDSGGPGGSSTNNSPGNYLDCSIPPPNDNALNCTSVLTLCGQGIVCIKFNSFLLASGADNVIIRNGDENGNIIANASGGSFAGLTFTSSDLSGCISVEFHGTSILNSAGWDADIIVKTSTTGQVPGPNCNLVCVGQVNASMPADPGVCYRTLTYLDFLLNPNCTDYLVALNYPFGTNANQPAGGVDRSHIGYTFIYRVIDINTQNSCWGYVTVEDKAAPILICRNRKVTCFQIAELEKELGNVVDNCYAGKATLEKLTLIPLGDGCTDPRGIALVAREIGSSDAWGNYNFCKDTLTITRDSLQNVKCPDLVELNCRIKCNSSTYNYIFTDNKNDIGVGNLYYPSPEVLLKIKKDCPSQMKVNGLPTNEDSKVVPQITDSIFYVENGVLKVKWDSIDIYPALGGVCKTTVGYSDEILKICPLGKGFKIRRQWRIVNWCTGKDTVCVQYIKVEDKEKPIVSSIPSKDYVTNAHDCYAWVDLPKADVDDCSLYDQTYTIKFTNLDGKIKVLTGTLPDRVLLPSPPYIYSPNFTRCFDVVVRTVDKCLNETLTHYERCVYDVTPPTPVCDEFTVTTVDPATCWARVYAKDLDNGSRDNCCDILHFAVADMDSIDYYTKTWVDYWNLSCKTDYWKYKVNYDKFLSDYINCFVFKDYLDLTECGDHRVVLRVYEACGVPRYDPHIFKCSEHDWYTYNTIKLCRAWHNYTFFNSKGAGNCDAKPKNWCRADWELWFNIANETTVNPFGDNNVGLSGINCSAFAPLYNTFYPGGTDGCAIDYLFDCIFYFPRTEKSNSVAPPGNRCSNFLYNDCMVNVHVDDKTPPVCEGLHDLFYYCDGVFDVKRDNFPDYASEYANLICDIKASFPDYTCRDKNGSPYWNVELTKEDEDSGKSDWFDPTGKYYGYYGCAEGVSGHPLDEHTPQISGCPINERGGYKYSQGWAPIYCHTWLTLDQYDQAGKKATPKFWTPKLRNQGPNGPIVRGTENGEFTIWDNCWIGQPKYKDDSYVDQCGNGWLSRTWEVGDKCDAGKVTCTQKIFTKHRSDFEVMFPSDSIIYCSADGDLSPDVTGRPMIMDDECELVGVNYEDVRFDIIADACYKIVRTWTLIDWCKYDPNQHNRHPEVIFDDRFTASADRYCVFRKLKDDGDGYMTYTQIIKVQDTIAPVVACKSDTVCILTGYNGVGAEVDCSVPNHTKVFAATDDCTPANRIAFRYTIKNAGGTTRASGPNQTGFTSLSGDLTVGVNTLTVIASDRCGNEDTTSCTILVRDCKKPTPYCYDGIATVVMPSSGEVTVWASDLNLASYDNCTKKNRLFYTFDAAGTQQSKIFKCADAKPGLATMYVWDGGGAGLGNFDFCTVSLSIQSNDPACQPAAGAAGAIAGKIATESTEPVENVVLDSKGGTFKTDAKGTYSFTGLALKNDYTITPKRDDDPTNGVSTIDLVLIQKHILGVQPLNSAYKVIAADVDRSNDVSAVDLVELRKLILTVYDKLPNNTSWRFVPKSYNFSNTTNPWGFPEKIDVTGLSKDELNRDFVGVKIGDVNGTVVPHSLLGAEAREAGAVLKFHTSDRQMKAGEEAIIEFTAENFSGIEGYQFSLAVRGLELKAVNSGVLKVNEGNFGMTKLGEGYVTTSWNDSKGISATGTEVLFSIKVKATKALTLSDALVINSKYTRAEAYQGGDNIGVSLEVGTKSVGGYALHQNTPNPFKANTVISYNLAKNEKVTLKITDVTGRVVRVYTKEGQKGYNQLTVNRTDVSGAGVLYYTIETKDYSATKKMILVD